MDGMAEHEQVNRALGQLESALVENLVIDVQHKRITFDAHSRWSDGEHRYSVAFEGVASFYVVLGAKEARFDPPPRRPVPRRYSRWGLRWRQLLSGGS